MTLSELNNLDKKSAKEHLLKCCESNRWADLLLNHFPFEDGQLLVSKALEIWYNECDESDWKQAFLGHPKIGDLESLEKKFANTKEWAGNEQSGVETASKAIITELAKANADYEQKFGYIFIVCATGKSAEEMLQILQDRLENNPETEIHIAMGEQHKITLIRLKKLLTDGSLRHLGRSHITTHVLDTSLGRPGQQLSIRLKHLIAGKWQTLAQGVTDNDGRIGDLLPAGKYLTPGNYAMVFDTGSYFQLNNIKGFYPEVSIQFTVFDRSHYHVPLLINPFGYSTYRGS